MSFSKIGDSELLSVMTVTGTSEEKQVMCPHCKTLVKVTSDLKLCPKCGGALDDTKSEAK